MDTFKSLSGLIFVVGMPLFCLSLLRNYRKHKTHIPMMGWTLLAIGLLIVAVASVSYLPLIIFFPENRSGDSVIYFLVWVVPAILMAYTGFRTRNKPKSG